MKTKNNWLAILALSMMFPLNGFTAEGGNSGGGGGGLCIGKKCITLAEAGFRLSEKRTPIKDPVISSKTFQRADEIIRLIGFKNTKLLEDFILEVIASPHVFEKVIQYDNRSLKKIRKEYLALIEESGLSKENFKVLAYSNREKTYLMPEFYAADTNSQALTLIHEAIVRATGSFTTALRLDGHIQDMLESKSVEMAQIVSILTKATGIFSPKISSRNKKELILGAYIQEENGHGRSLALNLMTYREIFIDLEDSRADSELAERYPKFHSLLLQNKISAIIPERLLYDHKEMNEPILCKSITCSRFKTDYENPYYKKLLPICSKEKGDSVNLVYEDINDDGAFSVKILRCSDRKPILFSEKLTFYSFIF